MKQKLGLILGPAVALAILLFAELEPGNPLPTRCAAVAALMAIWWVTEALPIPATALLPVALFPALGVLKGSTVAGEYFNSIIFLFIGGFIVALAMQRWNLHKRIALITILTIGSGTKRIIFGFMLATFVMSMWVSNTATTMMMVPMALAIIQQMRVSLPHHLRGGVNRFAVALLIGIAYAASIGGTATLIGTPPNLVLARQLAILFPELPAITFAQWMLFALPFALVFLVVCWWLLTRLFLGKSATLAADIEMFRCEYAGLGRTSYQERVVFFSFCAMALLWIFRQPIELGAVTIPGWSGLMPEPGFIDDGMIAIAVALALFVIPARNDMGERIMDWQTATELNWGIVILFGGGFALAEGFVQSGLSSWLGAQVSGLAGVPSSVFVVSVSTMMTFLTELTSNTASTQMILPVLGAFAQANQVAPLLLLIPATLSASCAFMLPVATPPNAIVFGSGEISMGDMLKSGLIMNFVGVVLVTLTIFTLGALVFNLH
ncbi:MAG TPA: SLC13 family permease [candidate division Zixibacteria bacterium]|nr:SLC13 family permease [candidate division Zixibacteria bacterium]